MSPATQKPTPPRALDAAETEQRLREIRAYGYAVVPQFLAATEVARLKTRVEQHWQAIAPAQLRGRPARDAEDRLVYNLQNKDLAFVQLLEDPFTQHVMGQFLNDPYYRFLPPEEPNYILSYYNARSSGQALDLHVDTYIPAPGDRTWAMQVVYLLDDMNDDNGCTVAVPGSHLSGRYSDRSLARVVPIHAKAGDLVIWDSRLWHGTRANSSGRSRWALVATFTCWWIKQNMDMTRSLPEDIYRTLSDRQKAMLGFCSIPPRHEGERINTKTGYDALLPSVKDYYPER